MKIDQYKTPRACIMFCSSRFFAFCTPMPSRRERHAAFLRRMGHGDDALCPFATSRPIHVHKSWKYGRAWQNTCLRSIRTSKLKEAD